MQVISSMAARLLLLATFFALPVAHAQGLSFIPGSINFTNTAAGSVSAEQTVSVQFIPSPPMAMTLNVTSVGPPSNSAFTVTSNTCLTGSYAPFAICEVKFTFTAPPTAGPVLGTFSFVTNELGPLNIGLSGNSEGAAPQAITFTSTAPSGATVDGTYEISATGGGSGNPVLFSIDPSSVAVCSVSGSTVSFLAPGNCIVLADQAGSPAFEVAPQQSQSFEVAAAPLMPQVINFTSTAPGTAFVGGTYEVAAAGGASGEPVVLTIDASASIVCSIAGNTVSLLAEGTCVIHANQAGNAIYAVAPQAEQSFTVSAAPVIPSQAATPVPVVGAWGLALLTAFLSGFAFMRQRSRL